jgi:hypothetical protein
MFLGSNDQTELHAANGSLIFIAINFTITAQGISAHFCISCKRESVKTGSGDWRAHNEPSGQAYGSQRRPGHELSQNYMLYEIKDLVKLIVESQGVISKSMSFVSQIDVTCYKIVSTTQCSTSTTFCTRRRLMWLHHRCLTSLTLIYSFHNLNIQNKLQRDLTRQNHRSSFIGHIIEP